MLCQSSFVSVSIGVGGGVPAIAYLNILRKCFVPQNRWFGENEVVIVEDEEGRGEVLKSGRCWSEVQEQ